MSDMHDIPEPCEPLDDGDKPERLAGQKNSGAKDGWKKDSNSDPDDSPEQPNDEA